MVYTVDVSVVAVEGLQVLKNLHEIVKGNKSMIVSKFLSSKIFFTSFSKLRMCSNNIPALSTEHLIV